MNSRRFESFARAAMLGLLAAAQTGCDSGSAATDSSDEPSGTDSADGSGGFHQGDGDGDETDPTPTEPNATGGSSDGMGGEPQVGGAGGALPEGVTSSRVIPGLGLEEFTEMCGEAGGVVETHATCGGVVSGPGFSYDDDTEVFTEHTCAGINTCSGFSCVIDD